MQISEEGKQLIKKFEGCELEAYKCAAGKWTIGYGRTKQVKEGDVCTQEQADQWLTEELPVYGAYVSDAVLVPINQNEFDALVAWTYNLGPSNLNREKRLIKYGKIDKRAINTKVIPKSTLALIPIVNKLK